MTLDRDARYRVNGWPGVAVWTKRYERTPRIDEETGEEIRIWLGECDDAYDINEDMVYVVMVGDNQEHLVDAEDLILIDDEAYCHVCGQLGCTHDGLERD